MLIYLIGYMGSGKTTAGKVLAEKLDYTFLDLDKHIENKYKINIPDLFAKYDEGAFRKLERETLHETFKLKNTVVSTGGGTPCFYKNIESINKNGLSIYLQMNPKSLYERLARSKKKRPLLVEKYPDEILDHITNHLETREKFYNQAKMIVDGEDLDIEDLGKRLQKEV